MLLRSTLFACPKIEHKEQAHDTPDSSAGSDLSPEVHVIAA